MALANYTKTCSKNTPGNSQLYIIEAASLNAVTIAAGEITAMTLLTGTTFKTIDVDMDSLVREEEGVGNKAGNISYAHKIMYKLSKLATSVNTHRDALADASVCGIVAMVKDGNGTWWVVGYNATDGVKRALRVTQSNVKSGAAPSDEDSAMAEFTLESSSGYPAYPVKSTSTVSTAGITGV